MKLKRLSLVALLALSTSCVFGQIDRGFKHPGGLHTQADFDRIKQQVAEGNSKVVKALDVLKKAEYAQSTVGTSPVETIVRGGGNGENYINAARGAAIAYQNALRWKIEGNKACANHAVEVLMKWANTTKNVTGNSDAALAYGLYGYEFAQAAELMRDYDGWKREDFRAFQKWMIDVWYPGCIGFLRGRNGTWENSGKWWQAPGHYWSNWGLCNAMAVISIGILCDDVFIYNQGMSFIKCDQVGTFRDPRTTNPILNDGLTEFWGNLIVTTTPWEKETGAYGKVGQMNESGRDTGHSAMALGLAVDIAHMGWNQGDDLFSFMDHRLAAGIEYIAAQCQSIEGLPWTDYHYGSSGYYYSDSRAWLMTGPAMGAQMRPYWGTVIGHYEGIKGVKMPFAETSYKSMGIDGGGMGSTSGGYDHLGYSVLMNTYGNEDGWLNPNPPTELTGKMVYKSKTYNLNLAGGTTNTYATTAVAQRGIAKGTEVTMIPEILDGSEDTGNWRWNTGETTRELTVTANESRMYRVTYTNAQGVESEQAFSIAVQGDCYESNINCEITYNNEKYAKRNLTVVKGSSVTLSISVRDGFGEYKWTNLKGTSAGTAQTKTLKVTKDTVLVGTYTNQGGRVCTAQFHLLVSDKALESDTERKADVGNYMIRHRYTDKYLTNCGDTAKLMPLVNALETPDPSQIWFLNRTEAGVSYCMQSLSDSLAMNISGLMKKSTAKVHRLVYAQESNFVNFFNSSKQYWVVGNHDELIYGSTTALDDFPFELIPVNYDPETGIQTMRDKAYGEKAYYTLSGMRTTLPRKGLNVVRYKDGTSKVILQK